MIRKATIGDKEIISYFNRCLAKETEDLQLDASTILTGVEKVLSDERKGIYYVYEISGEVVGQLMITTEWSDWRNGHFWWIQSVYVHKDFRGAGIFTKLYNHVQNLANNSSDVCGLRLYVEFENENAQNRYEALGMKKTKYWLYESENNKETKNGNG